MATIEGHEAKTVPEPDAEPSNGRQDATERISPRDDRAQDAPVSLERSAILTDPLRSPLERASSLGKHALDRLSEEGRYAIERSREVAVSPYRIVNEFAAAYHQFWADRHELKSARLKGEMDAAVLATEALSESRKDTERNAASMGDQRTPGADLLALRGRVLGAKELDLKNKIDRLHSKIEASENRKNLRINRRDAIADKLLSAYGERLRPMESRMESLEMRRDRLNLAGSVIEAEHQAEIERLEDIERRAKESLRNSGISEKEEGKLLKELFRANAVIRSRIEKERSAFKSRQALLDAKIARADRRTKPYQDKRDQLERIKQNRPVAVATAERTREAPMETHEDVLAHPRSEEHAERPAVDEGTSGPETSERAPRAPSSEYIAGWFDYLRQHAGKNPDRYNPENARRFNAALLRSSGMPSDAQLLPEEFRGILEKHLLVAHPGRDKAAEASRTALLRSYDAFVNAYPEAGK